MGNHVPRGRRRTLSAPGQLRSTGIGPLGLPLELLDELAEAIRQRLLHNGLVAVTQLAPENAEQLRLPQRRRAVETHTPITCRHKSHTIILGRARSRHSGYRSHLSSSELNGLTQDRVSPKPFSDIDFFMAARVRRAHPGARGGGRSPFLRLPGLRAVRVPFERTIGNYGTGSGCRSVPSGQDWRTS